jgi:hypothetical protein
MCGRDCEPSMVTSVAAEECQVSSLKHQNYNLKQLFSKDSMTSAIVGSNKYRSLFFSHVGKCSGSMCACRNGAAHFLAQTDGKPLVDYVDENKSFIMENVASPYLIILGQDLNYFVLRSFCAGDFSIQSLAPGAYHIT